MYDKCPKLYSEYLKLLLNIKIYPEFETLRKSIFRNINRMQYARVSN